MKWKDLAGRLTPRNVLSLIILIVVVTLSIINKTFDILEINTWTRAVSWALTLTAVIAGLLNGKVEQIKKGKEG